MYTLVRNSLNIQYKFTFSLLVKDLYSAIVIIKAKCPIAGKLLEFMYIGRGFKDIDDYKIDVDQNILKLIDCSVHTIYSNSVKCKKCLVDDCRDIGKLFYLTETEIGYYYFIACVCYVLESEYNDRLDLSVFNEDQLKNLKIVANNLKDMLSEFITF